MNTEITSAPSLMEEAKPTFSFHPKKFMLWLTIAAITMSFAGWTSAYLVRRAEGNWLEFEIPMIFWYSTGVLLVSSLFMHLSVRAAKKDQFGQLKTAISITFALGLVFLYLQVEGFYELVHQKLFLVGNPAVSFFDVLIFIHGLHIISGLIVLIFAFVAAWRMQIHAKKRDRIEMAAMYWHFLDALWLYLFIFLLNFR
ncbi:MULTISPECIES: cytochrome c oxidase subunit 3 [Siphonobacter]|uniref:Cytochrome oxidase subunit III n=1 Tax=Siphonobacter curvatus TaxID=2094562 RepID=A0A2S7IFR8_9BACT|nr:cytochrome c oxidase subunit 3 [Siphonobacter curvatus]PQA54048.1 cytochrome oxidase subunit III [Siphonobacter curvatus]